MLSGVTPGDGEIKFSWWGDGTGQLLWEACPPERRSVTGDLERGNLPREREWFSLVGLVAARHNHLIASGTSVRARKEACLP